MICPSRPPPSSLPDTGFSCAPTIRRSWVEVSFPEGQHCGSLTYHCLHCESQWPTLSPAEEKVLCRIRTPIIWITESDQTTHSAPTTRKLDAARKTSTAWVIPGRPSLLFHGGCPHQDGATSSPTHLSADFAVLHCEVLLSSNGH